jgi:acyl-CoA thioesterase-1
MKKWIVFLFTIFSFACYNSKDKSEIPALLPLILNKQVGILMLGDSLAERSNAFGLQEKLGTKYNIKNISISGRDVRIWLANKTTIEENKMDIVIVNLGTNDASYYPIEEFPTNYSNLVNYLETVHNWQVVLTLVPPTNDNILKTRIKFNNLWIKNTYSNKLLVDLESLFESKPELPLYPLADPIHPNQIGYDLIGYEYQKKILNLPIQNGKFF